MCGAISENGKISKNIKRECSTGTLGKSSCTVGYERPRYVMLYYYVRYKKTTVRLRGDDTTVNFSAVTITVDLVNSCR